MPACTRCKGLKMKCTYGPGQAICTRCVNDGQECLLSSRRPRFAVHRHPKATPSVEGVKVRTPQATASVDTLSSDDMDGDSTPLFTPDDGGLAPMPACTRCKELKMKCTYDPEHATCTRCINGGHECRIPSNGQRLPVRTQLLQPARTEEAVMETLRASESIALPVDDKDESDSNSDVGASFLYFNVHRSCPICSVPRLILSILYSTGYSRYVLHHGARAQTFTMCSIDRRAPMRTQRYWRMRIL